MAAPPIYKAFRPEDYPDAPDWALKMFDNINQTTQQTTGAMSRQLTRNENFQAGSKTDLPFTSAATGPTSVTLKTDLPYSPQHVTVSNLRKVNGQPLANAWSSSSKPTAAGSVSVTFQGLEASTPYLFNVLYE